MIYAHELLCVEKSRLLVEEKIEHAMMKMQY